MTLCHILPERRGWVNSTNDYALNAPTKANMQNSVDKFSMACDNFGLTISTKNTKVIHEPAPGTPYVEPVITIKGQRVKVVEKFMYLVMDDEVNTRLAKARAGFDRHNMNVWNKRRLRGNQNQGIQSCRSYPPPLWLWNMNNLIMAYKGAKPLSHELSEEDPKYDMARDVQGYLQGRAR